MNNYSPEFLGMLPIKKGHPYPEKLAKDSESSHQIALFAWCALPEVKAMFPELEWLHAIPNGGSRGDTKESRSKEGGKMKAEGVKPGVSDMFLPVRRGDCPGFYIELKRLPGPGVGPSDEQLKFGAFVQSQGYGFAVAYGWMKARDLLIAYLTQKW